MMMMMIMLLLQMLLRPFVVRTTSRQSDRLLSLSRGHASDVLI